MVPWPPDTTKEPMTTPLQRSHTGQAKSARRPLSPRTRGRHLTGSKHGQRSRRYGITSTRTRVLGGGDHFARFHTMSIATPGVSRFVNFISSAVMDVMIRRRLRAPTKFGNVLVSMFAWIVFVSSSTVYVPV